VSVSNGKWRPFCSVDPRGSSTGLVPVDLGPGHVAESHAHRHPCPLIVLSAGTAHRGCGRSRQG
jgi:hypothetical protein